MKDLCVSASMIVKGVGMFLGLLLRLGLQGCTIMVVSSHQCVYEVEIKRDVTSDWCRSSKIFMDAFSCFGRKTCCAQTKQVVLLTIWCLTGKKYEFTFTQGSEWWQKYSAEVSDSRSSSPGKEKGRCCLSCTQSKAARLQAVPPPQAESSGLCRSEPLACKCVLSAAQSLAVLTHWQEKILHNCQFLLLGLLQPLQ